MKKIKAYTLMEMVIVMLLTGIVLSITFKCYDLIYKSYLNYKAKNDALLERATIDKLLTLDFVNCYRIEREGERIDFLYKDGYSIQYIFEEEYLLRRQASMEDTFHIAPGNLTMMFQETKLENDASILDELSFESIYSGEIQKFHFKKEYDADAMMHTESTPL